MARDEAAVTPTATTDDRALIPAADPETYDALSEERRAAVQAFWRTVKRTPAYVRLIAGLARDGRVPHRARAALAVGGAYAVSPIDLVPGVIPVAGQLDDAFVLLMAIRQALRWTPAEVADEHLARVDLDREVIEADLAAVRELVRVGVVTGLRWGRRGARAGATRLRSTISTWRSRHA